MHSHQITIKITQQFSTQLTCEVAATVTTGEAEKKSQLNLGAREPMWEIHFLNVKKF
jgi:hypothetical protein